MSAKGRVSAKGWCPGALRPMMSGDGLIVRLRLSCNEATPAQFGAIAGWSRAFGNGALDLSARGNLQMRGVREAALPELTEALRAAGLLDSTAAAEAVRNVLASPFAGFDGPLDVRPFARAWEQALISEPELLRLPTKFCASFDAGAFPLGDDADLAFRAVTADAFVVRLGGASTLGPFAAERLVDVAKALARAFLASQETPAPPRRMRDAVAECGVAPFAEAARLPEIVFSPPPRRPPSYCLGAQTLGAGAFVGLGLPFGRIASQDLSELTLLAQDAATLRLTPWRAIVVPGLTAQAARALAERARRLPLILDPDDARLRVSACPGAPACSSGLGETRAAAARLAPFAARALHVSGCDKGCAHPGPAPFTVVATATGYDLVLDGRADASPVARGLSLDAVGARLAARSHMQESLA